MFGWLPELDKHAWPAAAALEPVKAETGLVVHQPIPAPAIDASCATAADLEALEDKLPWWAKAVVTTTDQSAIEDAYGWVDTWERGRSEVCHGIWAGQEIDLLLESEPPNTDASVHDNPIIIYKGDPAY